MAPTLERLESALVRLERPLLYVMGAGYVVAGVLHFVVPHLYVQVTSSPP